MDISWEQALAWRMRRHYLLERASPDDLVTVVDRLRGLHAQVMSSVDLALWARIDGLERDAVGHALWRQRTLVKMWAMRATLHVLPAADLGTWIAGLSIWQPGTWPLKDLDAIPLAAYIEKALRGKVLTRSELAAAMTKLGAAPRMVEGRLSIEIEPFAKLPRWTRTPLAAEAERLADFLGGDLKLTIQR